MSSLTPVRPKDWADFHCRLCGNCCRDLEEQLMPEILDVFHFARYLREQGEVEYIEDVYNRYTHVKMLEDCYPIFVMNTTGPDNACAFLKDGRCSIYEVRPRTCRLYPFNAFPGQRGKAFEFYQSIDQHAAHYTGGKVLVKDWMYQNLKREDREFLTAESTTLLELGRLLRALSPEQMKENLFQILYYRYYNYDLDQPFMSQYERNMEELKGILQGILGR